jgi:serine protease AprX
MAEKTVVAHFMHEHELAEAQSVLEDPQVTASYVVGRADDSKIGELRKHGLIVQLLDDEPVEETVPRFRDALEEEPNVMTLGMRAAGGPQPGPVVDIDTSGPNFYLIRVDGPLLEGWTSQLEQLGVTLLERVPPSSFSARLEPDQAQKVAALSFVIGLRPFKTEDAGPVMLSANGAPPLEGPGPTRPQAIQTYDVRLHRDEDRPRVEAWLQEHNVPVAGSSRQKIRIYALEEAPVEEQIRSLPEVESIVQYVEPKLFNDVARVLLGVEAMGPGNPGPIELEGEGEIVAIADTGLDDAHPDFAGRIEQLIALGRENDPSDPHGHGTHVAGSVLGDGAASDGKVRGVAPKARLFFQSLLDSRGRLGGLPVNLGELFKGAYDAGARIHNNSWGSATESAYTGNSEDVDDFVAEHRDMLIVIAAGNEGQAATSIHSPAGFPDWLSIGSPATSKNALTVGASRCSRTEGGYSAFTWHDAWPLSFPDAGVGDTTVSGDAESLAAFSSRGPCDDRRIKPDVVAPGTDIVSTKSFLAPLSEYWGPYGGSQGRYAFMGGTSMAAPLVSGCAVLVREYYVKKRQHQPSAALLKATLINGARWLTGADSIADQTVPPNYNQGFGAIHMPWTLPNPTEPNMKLEFVDDWEDPQGAFTNTGDGTRFRVTVGGGKRLRICLAYTDRAARGLQNDLNVFVEEPSGAKRVGNEHLPERLTEEDRGNNVEVVRIDDPAPGDYLIQVSTFNLLGKSQDYALVVTGELTSALAAG